MPREFPWSERKRLEKQNDEYWSGPKGQEYVRIMENICRECELDSHKYCVKKKEAARICTCPTCWPVSTKT